jgi:uncharacterized protein (DUF362 family)
MAEVTVALVQGEERATNVAAALAAIEESVDLSGCRHVLVKPNLVALDAPLACTHRDALRATLAFVRARYGGRLTI